MKNNAVAVWNARNRPFKGTLRTGSGQIVNAAYVAPSEPIRGRATNSIELMAAALATCFSISLAAELDQLGLRTRNSTTTSTITADLTNSGWIVSGVHLKVLAKVPGATPGDFISATIRAKLSCPVCRLLNVEIAMDAKLQG